VGAVEVEPFWESIAALIGFFSLREPLARRNLSALKARNLHDDTFCLFLPVATDG